MVDKARRAASPAVLAPEARLAWLRLARSRGVGPVTFVKLLERYGSPQAALKALPSLALRGGEDGSAVCSIEAAELELAAVDRLGATMVALVEGAYPKLLKEIPDPPTMLTIHGRAACLDGPCVAVVGARNASGNGRLFAAQLGRELAAAGVVVVSGLARGIDTAAHEGVLAAGGETVAVIAAGVDVAYPPENADLMARVAETGAVVSERPMGAEVRAKDFPRRNRIIAGLSLGVVVVEAAPGSGSLITARLAGEQGREVMAVPGSPLDPRHKGTNQLLREGATLVQSAADVLEVLGPVLTRRPAPRDKESVRPSVRTPVRREVQRPVTIETGPLPVRLVAALGPAPLGVDELIRQCQASPPEIQAALLELELDGRLERHPGNRVSLRAG